MIPVLHGVWASGGLAGDFEHIETITVGAGGASSVTFSSIAGTYKHLQIRGIARTSRTGAGGDYLGVRFNGVTTSSYSFHDLYGVGGGSPSVFSSGAATQTFCVMQRVSSASESTNVFGAFVTDILDYASTTKYKTLRNLGGYDNNGSGQMTLDSGSFQNTAAITSIELKGQAGSSTIQQYSTFSLYGVK